MSNKSKFLDLQENVCKKSEEEPKKPDINAPRSGKKTNIYSILTSQIIYFFNIYASRISIIDNYYSESY